MLTQFPRFFETIYFRISSKKMDKRTANGSPPHKGSLPAIDKDGDFRSEEVVPFFFSIGQNVFAHFFPLDV